MTAAEGSRQPCNKRSRILNTLSGLPVHISLGRQVLCLSESPDQLYSSFEDFLFLLETGSTGVEAVHLDGDFFHEISRQEQERVLLEIGRMPALKDLFIGRITLSVQDLSLCLKMATSLKTFQLVNVDLNGDNSAFREFQSGLYQHESLTRVAIKDFSVNEPSISLDPVIETMSSIQNLEVLEIVPRHDLEIRAYSVETICKSSHLREINLSHLAMLPCDAAKLERALDKTGLKGQALCRTGNECSHKESSLQSFNVTFIQQHSQCQLVLQSVNHQINACDTHDTKFHPFLLFPAPAAA